MLLMHMMAVDDVVRDVAGAQDVRVDVDNVTHVHAYESGDLGVSVDDGVGDGDEEGGDISISDISINIIKQHHAQHHQRQKKIPARPQHQLWRLWSLLKSVRLMMLMHMMACTRRIRLKSSKVQQNPTETAHLKKKSRPSRFLFCVHRAL